MGQRKERERDSIEPFESNIYNLMNNNRMTKPTATVISNPKTE